MKFWIRSRIVVAMTCLVWVGEDGVMGVNRCRGVLV